MATEESVRQGNDTIQWHVRKPTIKASLETKLLCSLLDVMSSPDLKQVTYAQEPYFPLVEKLCYRYHLRPGTAVGLDKVLEMYKIPNDDVLYKSVLFEIKTHKKKKWTGAVEYHIEGQAKVLYEGGDIAKNPASNKSFECRREYSWEVSAGETELAELSEELNWECIATILEFYVTYTYTAAGSKRDYAGQRKCKDKHPNPLESLGYLGWLGTPTDENRPNFRRKP
ncbi:uncharacterized protein LY89DRAFT_676931 [Mollisia scopiformis]|uniref:Uncharacterized protein n=1 Tax=Mollisia scopiformis TaxID=149040 RepID=A0A132B7Z2_MOLSC|nr:uncharacterized protein LY89DRAFT_676931 [Mollisia scopiformis]KUJ08528.1 hypothetical protein LY89DRAFT_676931 [Mollisia scopiformis]